MVRRPEQNLDVEAFLAMPKGALPRERPRGAARGAPREHALRYWDSSALVPLLLVEESSATMDAVSWARIGRSLRGGGRRSSASSALARRERDGSLDEAERRDCRSASSPSWRRDGPRLTPNRDALRDSARRLVACARPACSRCAPARRGGRPLGDVGETTPPVRRRPADERLACGRGRGLEGFEAGASRG